MKMTKLLALFLVLALAFSALVACDMSSDPSDENGDPSVNDSLDGGNTDENGGNTDNNGGNTDNNGGNTDNDDLGKAPETAEEYLAYFGKYSEKHPYKLTTVSTEVIDGDEIVSETIMWVDGTNIYFREEDPDIGEFIQIWHNGTIYLNTSLGKKKMALSEEEYNTFFGGMEDISNSLMDDAEMELTRNGDGTALVTFEVTIMGVTSQYEMYFDAEYRLFKQITTSEASMMGMTMTSVSEDTYEYSDQYKVSAPEDADEYIVAESFDDLFS